MRKRAQTTSEELRKRRSGKSFRLFAIELGYDKSFAATLSAVEKGHPGAISHERENELRHRLGLDPLRVPQLVEPCPTCGRIHAVEDCQGGEIVVIKKSAKRKPRRDRRHRLTVKDEDYQYLKEKGWSIGDLIALARRLEGKSGN